MQQYREPDVGARLTNMFESSLVQREHIRFTLQTVNYSGLVIGLD